MLIKNIKTEFCSDQYQDTEIFHANISDGICQEIIEREKALFQLNLNFKGKESVCGLNTLSFAPYDCFCPAGMIICITVANNGFVLEIQDDDDYTYESEWLPIEALTKERFLLMFGDDREVYEFNQDECDDIDEFTAIYAPSLEDATNQLLELVADSRECFGEQEDADHIREMKS